MLINLYRLLSYQNMPNKLMRLFEQNVINKNILRNVNTELFYGMKEKKT